jgi:flagellar L-ring protein precursor FlgH
MTAKRFFPPLVVLCLFACAGCDTWDHFQKPPDFSSPGKVDAIPPTADDTQVVGAASMASLGAEMRGSLWRPGSKTFFRDPRARSIGDLLTVAVNLNEQAQFANQTALTRTTSNTEAIQQVSSPSGLASFLGHVFPGIVTDPLVATSGSDSTQGQGNIQRSETVVVNVATTVVRVLPNNNLEIAGSQEIRLNNELREMNIRGIVRPEDIASDNTISSDRVAEARIAYGGRGVSSDLQRPAWGQDLLNRLAPF